MAKRGITAPALLDAEVTAKVGLFSEQEIETFSQANKAWLQGKEAMGQEQLRTQLQHQTLVAQWLAFLHSLRSQAKVVMHLTTPLVCHAQGATDGALAKGPARKTLRRQKGAGLKRIFTPSSMVYRGHAPCVSHFLALCSMSPAAATRAAFYADAADWERFLALLTQVVQPYPWLCHAYCPMANYSHLLLEIEVGWTAGG